MKLTSISKGLVPGFSHGALAAALMAGLIGSNVAQAATVEVPGTADIWLAGMADGTSVSGYFGSESAPGNSPIALTVGAGNVLTFSATGSTSVDASCFAGPDGGCYADESGFSPSPASEAYKGPSNALVGVFMGSSAVDVSTSLALLDYTDPANISQASYAPTLGTIFFIGDGLTGTGTGSIQQFIAPVGATRLFLASADSIGSSTGNLGSLTVTVNAVPEPESIALLLAGLGVVGALRMKRSGQRSA